MKVLHLSSEKTWRGGEQQIAYLIQELTNLGIENYVICRKGSSFEQYCIDNLLEYISLPFKSSYELKTALEIKDFCDYMSIDIMHMHSSRGHTLGVISSVLGNKSKLILSRRVDFPVKNNLLSRWKYNYSKIKKIICVSEKIKEVMSPFIEKKNKLLVVHSGIDIKRFENCTNKQVLHKEYNLDKDTKIVANISAIAPHKDYFTFVDCVYEFKKISSENVKFFIIGEGNCREEIENYISDKELTKDIILTGFRNDIADILPELDLFLITSKEEGLGTTVLDAFANRVPVVATAGGGIPEMVKHEKTGLLYAIKDGKSLSKGVKLVLENENLKEELTSNAFQLLTDKFTKEQTAKKTLHIYKQLM